MLGYSIRRLLAAIPTMLLLIAASFVLIQVAPGGPFTSERPLPPQVLANIEARYGLDQPMWKQFWDYLYNIVFHFDFGPSFKFKDRDVNDIIAQGFLRCVAWRGKLQTCGAALFADHRGIAAGICRGLFGRRWTLL